MNNSFIPSLINDGSPSAKDPAPLCNGYKEGIPVLVRSMCYYLFHTIIKLFGVLNFKHIKIFHAH